jgi:predicted secreted protein
LSQVGYQKAVQIKTTAQGSSLYAAIPGNAASMTVGADMLDDTDFTSTGWRSRVVGLRDYSISVTSNYGTTGALATIRSAMLNGTKLDMRYLPNGTVGLTGRVLVENFSPSGDVGGLETIDISLQSEGVALTTV